MKKIIIDLYGTLSPALKRKLLFTLILMIIATLMELMSVALAVPLLTILMSEGQESYEKIPFFIKIYSIFGLAHIEYGATVIFILITALSACLRVAYLKISLNSSFSVAKEIGNKIYDSILNLDYARKIELNSGDVISAITNKVDRVIHMVVIPLFSIINAAIMATVFVVAILFTLNKGTLGIIIFLGGLYLVIAKLSKKAISTNSRLIAINSSEATKEVQQGLGAFRNIAIDKLHELFYQRFDRVNTKLRKAEANTLFVSQSPKYLIEAISVLAMMLLVVYYRNESGDISSILPIVGALALALQKLLPMVQQAYNSWATIRAGKESLFDVCNLIKKSNREVGSVGNGMTHDPYFDRLDLVNVSFAYNNKIILDNVNITIENNKKYGIVGRTGSGKSTLLDILMQLHKPSTGIVSLNGKNMDELSRNAYHSIISHVPQNVYLLDGSIKENIVLSMNEGAIDSYKLERACTLAQLDDWISELPCGLESRVGENGVQISGGQKQRIGIARALYKNSKIIFFDEATSALDLDTERKIIEGIHRENKSLAMVFVAHRTDTLRNCDFIIAVKDQKVTVSNYEKNIL